MKSADMLQSFSHVCRMFHFGSSRLFQHMFDEHEPNTIETDVLFKTNIETNDETTDSEDECHVVHLKRQTVKMSSYHVVIFRILSRRLWHI